MCWMKDSKLYYISQDHELYLFLVFHSLMCLEILYSEHKLMKCLLQCTLCKLIPVVGNRRAWTLLLGFFEILSVICIHMLMANYWWHFCCVLTADLKPVITTLTKLYHETSGALGGANPSSKRQIEDNSKKIGSLFAKLNSGDISSNAASKLRELCHALDSGDFESALHTQVYVTTTRSKLFLKWKYWGTWIP